MKRIAKLLLVFIVVAGLYLSFWPTGFDAQNWTPPNAPDISADRALATTEVLGDVAGPEDIEVTAAAIYAGLSDGRVIKMVRQAPHTVTTILNTKGRPLGIDFGQDGSLYIADVEKGVLQWKDDQLTVLVPASDTYRFIDDVVIANNTNKLYFSNASERWGLHDADADILEHKATGSIIEYDLNTKTSRTVAKNLGFANGVTLSQDEKVLYFNETAAYRVWRYEIATDKLSVLAENLPGLPDNISTASDGLWVALFTPRNDILDSLADKAWLRNAIFRLPKALMPEPAHHALAVKLSFDGTILRTTEDSSLTAYAPITSVIEVENGLYLSSLWAMGVGYVDLGKAD